MEQELVTQNQRRGGVVLPHAVGAGDTGEQAALVRVAVANDVRAQQVDAGVLGGDLERAGLAVLELIMCI